MQLRRALVFAYAEKYGGFVIGLASTMVISRLLGPEDVGIFAIGMALVGLAAAVRDLGVSTYVVQETDLTDEQIRSAFTVAMLAGFISGALVLAAAIPAGHYYGDTRVTSVVAILSLNFLIMPFGSISQALLSRDMRFDVLAWIRLLFAAMQGGVGAWLSWRGWGPIGLAWASVVAMVSNAIISFAARGHSCRPVLDFLCLRRVVAVGGPATAVAIADEVLAAAPELILGRAQGLADTGLLSRARGLSQMAYQLLARAAGPVFFGAFAEKFRSGETTTPLYLRATTYVVSVGWAMLSAMYVLAAPVIVVLFGPNWTAVAAPLRYLCLAAAATLLTSGANHLLLATGGALLSMRAKLTLVPIAIVCCFGGAHFGVEALGFALLLAAAIGSMLMMSAVSRHSGIPIRLQLVPARDAALLAVGSGAGASLGLLIGTDSLFTSFLGLLIGAFGAISGCAIALALARKHPLRAETLALWKAVTRQGRTNGAQPDGRQEQ